MRWQVSRDQPSLKEIWLLFENDAGNFPLKAGAQCRLGFSYTVSDQKWGRWLHVGVRVPTSVLVVEIGLPSSLEPELWGSLVSPDMSRASLENISRRRDDDTELTLYSLETNPPLNARYRFKWELNAPLA